MHRRTMCFEVAIPGTLAAGAPMRARPGPAQDAENRLGHPLSKAESQRGRA